MMDRFRFTTLAHGDHLFCSPMSSARADELVELLDLPAASRVLDVGCGKAEFLLRAVRRYAATAVGVDPNGDFLDVARAHAAARGLVECIEWHERPAADLELEPASFDLALCLGSSHAFGTFEQALTALTALVRPGGQILIADPYWRHEPAAGYLASLGATATTHLTHAGNE